MLTVTSIFEILVKRKFRCVNINPTYPKQGINRNPCAMIDDCDDEMNKIRTNAQKYYCYQNNVD